MRVLIDRYALQSRVHFDDGVRLVSFIAAVAEAGADVAFAAGPLTVDTIDGADVLVIPTRSLAHPKARPTTTEGRPYTQDELEAIHSFVHAGRGLLLMTNHGDVPAQGTPDHTEEDARLAARFGIVIERSCFATEGGPTTLRVDATAGDAVLGGIRTVVTMTSASLRGESAIPLVPLAATMADRRGGLDPARRHFAVRTPNLRVIVTGNSGFVGTPGTRWPNQGLFAQGDNARFVVNAIRWLASGRDQ